MSNNTQVKKLKHMYIIKESGVPEDSHGIQSASQNTMSNSK